MMNYRVLVSAVLCSVAVSGCGTVGSVQSTAQTPSTFPPIIKNAMAPLKSDRTIQLLAPTFVPNQSSMFKTVSVFGKLPYPSAYGLYFVQKSSPSDKGIAYLTGSPEYPANREQQILNSAGYGVYTTTVGKLPIVNENYSLKVHKMQLTDNMPATSYVLTSTSGDSNLQSGGAQVTWVQGAYHFEVQGPQGSLQRVILAADQVIKQIGKTHLPTPFKNGAVVITLGQEKSLSSQIQAKIAWDKNYNGKPGKYLIVTNPPCKNPFETALEMATSIKPFSK